MIVVGERINSTRKVIADALRERDAEAIRQEARNQVEAGADLLDVNAAANPGKEIEDLQWLIATVQSAVDVPLAIDSPNPKAIAVGLSICKKTPMVNSITAERKRLEDVLPLVARHDASLVALALDDAGMPNTIQDRMKAISTVVMELEIVKIPLSRVYFDPLVRPISTEQGQAMMAVETIRAVKREFPEARTICGLSNISFGLPKRHLINRNFLALLVGAGLDAVITDPTEREIAGTLACLDALTCKDEFCLKYIQLCREGKI